MIKGLDPTSGPIPERVEGRAQQPRPQSLDGAVIGLVVNGLGESNAFLTALYEELAMLAPVGAAVKVVKPSVSVPPEPMDWERLISQVTVAVAGFGG
jgi:4-hydroxy-3-methylbut-2-en-1-yl diphosphate synthase IspG/GcpE